MPDRIDSSEFEHGGIHVRWYGRSRHPYDPDQCLHCRYFIPLDGPLGADWGVCANEASDSDGRLVYEHDHCDAFEPLDGPDHAE